MDLNLQKGIDFLTILFLISVTFSVTVAQTALAIAILLMIIEHKGDLLNKIKGAESNIPIAFFFVAAVVSLIFRAKPVQLLENAEKLKLFTLFASYYYFAAYSPPMPRLNRYFYVLIGAFSLILVYIIIQHYAGENALPFSFWQKTYKELQWEGGRRIYPLYGQFSSILMMCFLPILLFSKKITLKDRSLFIAVLLLMIAGLYLSFSRASIISVIASICFMLYFQNKKRSLLLFLCAILIGLAYYVRRGDNNLVTSIVSVTDPDNVRAESNKIRIEMVKDVVKIIKERPLTGIGYYGYRYYPQANGSGNDKIFSDYLNVLATTGILGFAPFIWLIFVFLKESSKSLAALKASYYDNDFFPLLSFGIFLSFIAFLINALFEPIFFNTKTLMLMLFLLAMSKKIMLNIRKGLK